MSLLVVDVGTSGVRGAVVTPDAQVTHVHHQEVLPVTPAAGLVEFDARQMAEACLRVASQALADAGPVDAVGIAAQRASTIVWDAEGIPVAAGQGWQDLRTIGTCLVMREQGFRLAPNQSAPKLAAILDEVDPERARDDLRFGTVDTWVAWVLSGGALHVTDSTNAGVTGLTTRDGTGWDPAVLEALRIPESILPRIVDPSGAIGPATALDGSPMIAGMAGDQQASLIGQGCVKRGMAKATFGTGGMLDVWHGPDRPGFDTCGSHGCFPIVTWADDGDPTWGVEGIILAAGSNVEWLRDDLGVIPSAEASHEIAAQCEDTEGVVFVPALLGLGTPAWDYGALGTLLGVTRGTARPQLVRAVLEGVAHRGADLLEAAEGDGELSIPALRVDGGMSANPTFVQALADACGRPVEVSPVLEATTLGAAFLAGLAVGTWGSRDDLADTWKPRAVVEPRPSVDRNAIRERWADAIGRAAGWHGDLSALDF